jgi:hypothetical protein
LNPHYHFRFVTPKGISENFQTFHGRQTIDGLPFDVDGECALYGKSQADWDKQQDDAYPDKITGIEIGRKFAELHLLHMAWWHEFHGCPIAVIQLHYSDGTTFDFELEYCVQVLANRLPTEEQEILTDPDSKLIWRGPGPWNGSSRLIKTVLRNPFPHKKVETMDVMSTRSRACYVLVAATVADAGPSRPITAALPLNQPGFQFDGSLKVRVFNKETGEPILGADVYPNLTVDGTGLVADPCLTSKSGEVIVKYPIARTSSVGVEVSKHGYDTRRDSWEKGKIPDVMTYRLSKTFPPDLTFNPAVHDAKTTGEGFSDGSWQTIPTGFAER